jgi:hypothetical protein
MNDLRLLRNETLDVSNRLLFVKKKLEARFLKSRNTIVDYYLDLLCALSNSALLDVTGRNPVENFSTVITERSMPNLAL